MVAVILTIVLSAITLTTGGLVHIVLGGQSGSEITDSKHRELVLIDRNTEQTFGFSLYCCRCLFCPFFKYKSFDFIICEVAFNLNDSRALKK